MLLFLDTSGKMAATAKMISQSCWEISLCLNPNIAVSKVLKTFTNEIAAFKVELKATNFPETPLGSWKLHTEMKLFVFSNSCEDVNRFLAWNSNLFTVIEKAERESSFGVLQALQDQDDKFVVPIVLISEEDMESSQV